VWIDAIVSLFLAAIFCTAIYQTAVLVLCWKYWRDVRRGGSPPPPLEPAARPFVTIQLPMYNESSVAARVIDAVARFDYPHDRMEIQVLDDSTDGSPQLIQNKIAELRQTCPDLRIDLLHRVDRSGFKAGALLAAMPAARGEFLAIFDADFIPSPDFLNRTLPWFAAPDVAVVQSRWGHLNASDSIITRFQEFFLDAHHSVEQRGRCAAGYFLTFNGTSGVWRRKAMEDAGGWSTETLVEDIDLSFRAQVRGWKIRFLEDYVTPGELPDSVLAMRVQLFRWMKGHSQVGRLLLPTVLRSRLPLAVKFHAFCQIFATFSIMASLAILLITGLLPIILAYRPDLNRVLWLGLAGYLWAPFVILVYGTPRLRYDEGSFSSKVLSFIPRALFFLSVMAGLSGQGTLAVLQGLFGKRGDWIVTPKGFAGGKAAGAPRRTQKRLPSFIWLDLPIALYIAASIAVAAWFGVYPLVVFMLVWLTGYLYLFAESWRDVYRPSAAARKRPAVERVPKSPLISPVEQPVS